MNMHSSIHALFIYFIVLKIFKHTAQIFLINAMMLGKYYAENGVSSFLGQLERVQFFTIFVKKLSIVLKKGIT